MAIHSYNPSSEQTHTRKRVKKVDVLPVGWEPQFMEEHVLGFFATANERQQIFLRKHENKWPYTEDKIFRNISFCNVFRELDKTTVWIAENIRDRAESPEQALIDVTACRYINRISSLRHVLGAGGLPNWNEERALEILADVSPVVNSAYVIHTPKGLDKLHGLCRVVSWVAREADEIMGYHTLQETHARLMQVPLLGQFMAYEIVSDMRWTRWLDDAEDILTWAAFGPGACRGLSLLATGEMDSISYSINNTAIPLAMGRRLLELSTDSNLWPSEWREWEMREVEHWLCEYAKYVGQLRGTRKGKKYNG